MPEQAMMFAPAGLLLAGAICLVWSTTATGPRHWRRRIATEALWAIAGLLALYNIAMTVYRLCTEPIGRTMIGDSIAVNGCCLTVVALQPNGFEMDVSRETLDCTAGFAPGARLNLEKMGAAEKK